MLNNKRIKEIRRAPLLSDKVHILLCALIVVAVVWLQSLQLVISCGGLAAYFKLKMLYKIGNLLPPAMIGILLFAASRRWRLTLGLGSILVFLWSVANHYTYLFSGNAITISILSSLGTAMNVLGGYRFTPNLSVILLLAGLVLELFLAFLLGRLAPEPAPLKWALPASALLAIAVIAACVPFVRMEISYEWFNVNNRVEKMGYGVYFIRETASSVEVIHQPAGYEDADLEALAARYTGVAGDASQYPDIILILNESFFDMERYTDIMTDVPVMDSWYSIDNAIRGHVATAFSTNGTEYELLTGNLVWPVSSRAPFIDCDMRDVNSAARYLKELGYETWAMHEAPPSNYGRGIAYPALGFDQVRFEDDFSYTTTYGNRKSTDAANYMDMLDWYVSAQDGPRFMYLLTYQNHGGYAQNDSSLDTVHTSRDFGNYTDDMNEYLTGIRMSCEAFAALTENLDAVDRPVLVCMLGDHDTHLTEVVPPRPELPGWEADLFCQTTPFLLWANDAFGHLEPKEGVELTATDIMPLILKTAGMPLSPYYQCILETAEKIPYRLQNGAYRSADGAYGFFEPEDSRFEDLAPYCWMEYGGLREMDRCRSFFHISNR